MELNTRANDDDEKGKGMPRGRWNSSIRYLWDSWKSRGEFLKAQLQMFAILILAWCGNNWPVSYPRDENEDHTMFWVMNSVLAVTTILSLKHDPAISSKGIQVLSRDQTEEWKGWMQWAFIMVRVIILLNPRLEAF